MLIGLCQIRTNYDVTSSIFFFSTRTYSNSSRVAIFAITKMHLERAPYAFGNLAGDAQTHNNISASIIFSLNQL